MRLCPPWTSLSSSDGGEARGLLRDTAGGRGYSGLSGILADPPPPPDQKMFPQGENEIHERGQRMEGDFRYTNLFVASDPPTHPSA